MTLYKATENGTVAMTADEESAFIAQRQTDAARVYIPQEVTMRQARLALLGAGLLANVEATLAALTEPRKSAAKIEWEYSQSVQRTRGLVVDLSAALGLTPAQVDKLFIAASSL